MIFLNNVLMISPTSFLIFPFYFIYNKCYPLLVKTTVILRLFCLLLTEQFSSNQDISPFESYRSVVLVWTSLLKLLSKSQDMDYFNVI